MKKGALSFFLSVVLVTSLCCGNALAVEPKASNTLSSYMVDLFAGSNPGEIEITFDVRSNSNADLVGISSITIYKSNGTKVATITGSTDNNLLRSESMWHRDTYVYLGTSGTSYYASVTVYAKIGNQTDSRRITTSVVTAP